MVPNEFQYTQPPPRVHFLKLTHYCFSFSTHNPRGTMQLSHTLTSRKYRGHNFGMKGSLIPRLESLGTRLAWKVESLGKRPNVTAHLF